VFTFGSQRSVDDPGYWPGDVVGTTPFDLLPPVEGERARAFFEETAARKAPIVDFESWYIGADGERHYLLTNGVPLLDEAGNLKGYRGADRDITLRKRAEEALRQTTERLTLATQAGGVGVWEVDVTSKAVTFDDRMFALYGMEPIPPAEINAAWRARLHPEDRERVEAMLAMALQGDLDVDHDIRAVWPDGSIHVIRSVAQVERDASGRPVRMIGTSRDVTMYRESELELRRLREEEALHQREEAVRAAVVTERSRLARDLHDSVTQALFAASLRGEELQRLSGQLTPKAAEALGDLVVLTRGALAEMRSLLLELRPDALESVPLRELFRQLVGAAESRAVITVSLAADCDARPPDDVKLVLYRVAQESLNNVVRHSRARHAWVELEDANGALRLVVRDDGCGFDPSQSRAGKLGLNMMRERAASIGARLQVRSRPQEGTEVTLEWPKRTGVDEDG
jgi:PAS domain S-box-containing protein